MAKSRLDQPEEEQARERLLRQDVDAWLESVAAQAEEWMKRLPDGPLRQDVEELYDLASSTGGAALR